MQPSLGKMSAYKMFNWRDRAASSVEQTVVAFLEIGEAIATRWIQTAQGVLLLQMVPDNGASGPHSTGGCFGAALSRTGWCSPPRSLEGRTPRAPGKVDSHLL
jgi:hypothetical protein